MRIHFSSVATIFVALLFVSGTVGCRSNGGDWYNPKTYSWTNPFNKDNPTAHRSATTTANTKPSFDSQPNLSTPPGGYSASTADRSASRSGGSYSPSSWEQQNQTATHIPPPHLGGYSDPVLSNNPPNYAMDGNMVGLHQQQHMEYVVPQQSQVPHQYTQGMGGIAQQQNMPYGPSDYVQTDYRQPANAGSYQQIQQAPGTVDYQGNYAPFGPVTVPPTGYNYEQPIQAPPSGFQGDAGFQQQPWTTGVY